MAAARAIATAHRMNPQDNEAWKRDALDLIFEALAASATLESKVAYKGARVLARLLDAPHRYSYDIDLNLIQTFVETYPDLNEQARCLQHEIHIAIDAYTRRQDPVRYRLVQIQIQRRPKERHPHG